MSDTYRAGLIGCGAMGPYHLKALQGTPKVEIVALADISEERLKETKETWNVSHLYRDLQEMLSKESLDLVAVATQAPAHYPAVVACAEAGVKGILCEKPMALELSEADRMVAACEERGAVLAINHQLRLDPGVVRMKQLVAEGAIGNLREVCAHDKGGRPAGNSLMEIGTHLFDLMRFFAGDAEWVYGDLTTVDGRPVSVNDIMNSRQAYEHDRDCGLVAGERAFALFGFIGVVRGTYESYGMRPFSGWMYGVDLIGDEGRLIRRNGAVWFYRGVDWNPESEMERAWPLEEGAEGWDAGIGFMVADLVQAIEEGREPACSGLDGRASLEMAMGIYESHRGGARIMLPLEERTHPLGRWQEEEASVGW